MIFTIEVGPARVDKSPQSIRQTYSSWLICTRQKTKTMEITTKAMNGIQA